MSLCRFLGILERTCQIWLHNLIDQVIINYGEIQKERQQGHTLSNQIGSSSDFNSIVFQKPFWEVEDHALIGSKLSKQELLSIRTLIFKM